MQNREFTDQERAKVLTNPDGLRNRIRHAENMARCAFMATESPQVDQYIRDCIGTAIDHVVYELAQIVDDMDTAAGKISTARSAEVDA